MLPFRRGRGAFALHRVATAFTLIEVLVVVSIICLLVAILLPALAYARQQSRRIGCGYNLKLVGEVLNAYRADIGRYPDRGVRRGKQMYGSNWRPGDRKIAPSAGRQDSIGDVAEALVRFGLGDPRMLYCPVSTALDPIAKRPYKPVTNPYTGLIDGPARQVVPTWRTGDISYLYLVGLDPGWPEDWYPDVRNVPTINLPYESPDPHINRVNPRAVLIGDRDLDVLAKVGIPRSNHGGEGGMFCFTTGDVQWFPRSRLAAHGRGLTLWYWPRTARSYDMPTATPQATAP